MASSTTFSTTCFDELLEHIQQKKLSVADAKEMLVPFIVKHENRKMDLCYLYHKIVSMAPQQSQVSNLLMKKQMLMMVRMRLELARSKFKAMSTPSLAKPYVQSLFDDVEKTYSNTREAVTTMRQMQELQQFANDVDTKYNNMCLHYPELKYVPSLFLVPQSRQPTDVVINVLDK